MHNIYSSSVQLQPIIVDEEIDKHLNFLAKSSYYLQYTVVQ